MHRCSHTHSQELSRRNIDGHHGSEYLPFSGALDSGVHHREPLPGASEVVEGTRETALCLRLIMGLPPDVARASPFAAFRDLTVSKQSPERQCGQSAGLGIREAWLGCPGQSQCSIPHLEIRDECT